MLSNWIDEYEKPERLNFAIQRKMDGRKKRQDIHYWNNGYVTEACKCLLKYLFNHGHKNVKIDAMVDNIGSNRVIQKCGGVLQKTEWEERPLKNDTVLVNRYIIYADENSAKTISE